MLEELSAVFLKDGLNYADALKRYKKRRSDLKKQFRGPIVLSGVEKSLATSQYWVQLDHLCVQDPVFLYFTGLNQYNCAVVLNANGKDVLFLDHKNLDEEFWEGKAIGYEFETARDIKDLLSFDDIKPIDQLFDFVSHVCISESVNTLYSMWYVSEGNKKNKRSEFYYSFKNDLEDHFKKSGIKSYQLLSIESFTFKRLQLDKDDVSNMVKAIDISTDAFKGVCKQLQDFDTETDISGFLSILSDHSFPPFTSCNI